LPVRLADQINERRPVRVGSCEARYVGHLTGSDRGLAAQLLEQRGDLLRGDGHAALR